MKILLDLQALQSPGSRVRGIGRYTLSLTKAMISIGKKHEIWVLLNSLHQESVEQIRIEFAGILPPERIIEFSPPEFITSGIYYDDWCLEAAEKIREAFILYVKPDVVYISSLFEGEDCVVSIPRRSSAILTCVTLYDLIPLIFPQHYLNEEQSRKRYFRKVKSLDEAGLLFAISRSALNDGKLFLPAVRDRVVNISSAVDDDFESRNSQSDIEDQSTLEKFGLLDAYIMYAGGSDWRKNVAGLITAYSALRFDLQKANKLALVFHLDEITKRELIALCVSLKLDRSRVVFTGRVSDIELVTLYRKCALFIFPSLYEGFGLPVLEAMRCGAIVIGSETSSVSEAVGREDALFNPHALPTVTALIERALTDEVFRIELREHSRIHSKRFTWNACAEKALDEIERFFEMQQPLRPALENNFELLKEVSHQIENRISAEDENEISEKKGRFENSAHDSYSGYEVSRISNNDPNKIYRELIESIAKIPGNPSDDKVIEVVISISKLPFIKSIFDDGS